MVFAQGSMRGLLLGCALVTAASGQAAGEAACVQGQGACPWALDSADEQDTLSLLQVGLHGVGAEAVGPAKQVAAAKGATAAKDVSEHAQVAADQHGQEDEHGHEDAGQRKPGRKQAGSRGLEAADNDKAVPKGQANTAGEPAMENVLEAFYKVKATGTKMSFLTTEKFPSPGYPVTGVPYKQHFESVIRLQGGPYLAVSGHGPHANLFIVEMASAASSGEFGDSNVKSLMDTSPQNKGDKIVAVVDIPSGMTHAGGLGQWGNIVVVPVEEECAAIPASGCPGRSQVFFYDLSNPLVPKKLAYHIERSGDMGPAGAASVVQESDGTFLLMVGRANSYILDFYRSVATSLVVEDPGWTLIGTWDKSEMIIGPGMNKEFGKYQNLNMIRQQDGKLFFVGTTRDTPVIGNDWMDLFEMKMSAPAAAFQLQVEKQVSKKMRCTDNFCDFYAAAGVFINSPTQMFVYGIDWLPYSGVVTFNEFGAGTSCNQDTGGSCMFGYCSNSRGNAICSNAKCYCAEGHCSKSGVCVQE
mmetsp:Transcript_19145/g.50586  ORF Transcript_19145/g.50586 Transcript_19145/m.50586 type:complete len:527 (-) Transcript_19145:125-1705(-)